MRFSRFIAVLLGLVLCLAIAKPQIISPKKVGNKTIMCLHTGLFSDLDDCGVKADSYSYVFVGSISSIDPSADGEKRLEIRPEEIFHGDPPAQLTVFTSQGACLPKLIVGGRWLFYLRDEKGQPIVLDYYGNDSLPVGDAEEEIKILRRLETIGNRGLVRGQVLRGDLADGKPVGDATVVARARHHQEYVTNTNANGRYEFPPLPVGTYTISVRPIGSFHPHNTSLDVSAHGCWNLTLRHK
jgi:hypothetical protein